MKSKAKQLSKDIGTSFSKSKKRYGGTEVHHIVAQTATRAKPARKIFSKVGKKVSNSDNLIRIKKGLHRRLHRKTYYEMVNSMMKSAYDKRNSKRKNKQKVELALKTLRTYIRQLDEIAPF